MAEYKASHCLSPSHSPETAVLALPITTQLHWEEMVREMPGEFKDVCPAHSGQMVSKVGERESGGKFRRKV